MVVSPRCIIEDITDLNIYHIFEMPLSTATRSLFKLRWNGRPKVSRQSIFVPGVLDAASSRHSAEIRWRKHSSSRNLFFRQRWPFFMLTVWEREIMQKLLLPFPWSRGEGDLCPLKFPRFPPCRFSIKFRIHDRRWIIPLAYDKVPFLWLVVSARETPLMSSLIANFVGGIGRKYICSSNGKRAICASGGSPKTRGK